MRRYLVVRSSLGWVVYDKKNLAILPETKMLFKGEALSIARFLNKTRKVSDED